MNVIPPALALYVCAWLHLVIVRSGDILIVVKSNDQRTRHEQKRIARGLRRSIFLEALLFVPASATAMLVFAPLLLLLLPERLKIAPVSQLTFYGVLGFISYGFPFASVRHMITRMALQTLREFAVLAKKPPTEEDET